MANTQKYLNHLLQRTGITPACSEEERAAADVIFKIFEAHGFTPELQEFSTSANTKLVQAALGIVLFVGAILMGIAGAVGIVGFLLVLASGVLYTLIRIGRIQPPSIGAGGLSQNVIAYHKASGPLASPRNRPVVVVAHYDSPRADLLSQAPYATYRPILTKLLPYAMVAPVVIAIIRLLPIPDAAKIVLWILAILVALVPLAQSVAIIANRFVLPYTSGSVCNKSSVAALLGVMDAVAPYEGVNEFPDDVPFDDFMAEQQRVLAEAYTMQQEMSDEFSSPEEAEDAAIAGLALEELEEADEQPVSAVSASETNSMPVVPLTGATVSMSLDELGMTNATPAPDEDPIGATNVSERLGAVFVDEEGEESQEAPIPADATARFQVVEDDEAAEVEPEGPSVPRNALGNIRYGADAIRSLGMVSSSCSLVYEDDSLPMPPVPPVVSEPEELVVEEDAGIEEQDDPFIPPAVMDLADGFSDEEPVEEVEAIEDDVESLAEDQVDEVQDTAYEVFEDDEDSVTYDAEEEVEDEPVDLFQPMEVVDDAFIDDPWRGVEHEESESTEEEPSSQAVSAAFEEDLSLSAEDAGNEPAHDILFDMANDRSRSYDDASEVEDEQSEPVDVIDEGATQIFEVIPGGESSDRTQAMPVSTAPRIPVETVDSLMEEIHLNQPEPAPTPQPRRVPAVPEIATDAPQQAPQRRVPNLPSIERPSASRTPLLDLPDPSVKPADPFAPQAAAMAPSTGGFTVISSNVSAPAPAAPDQDAAPSPFETIHAPAPEPEQPRRGLGRLFGRKKKQQESMSDWLGVEEDFDAKEKGGEIGSWDNFDGDDNGWKGGATGLDDLTEEELRDAITSLGDDELLGHDIWFVATGASESDNAGIKAFLEKHRSKLRGVFLINLECVGAGQLSMVATEGERRVLKGDKRIMNLVSKVSSDFHHELGRVDMPFVDTDAYAAMCMSLRSLTIAGVDATHFACSHSEEDQAFNVDADNVRLAADVVTEVIRRS